MSYEVHNFQNGEIIEAGPVNEMDAQILLNSTGKIAEPAEEGTSGQVLTTDGEGGRSWSDLGIEVVRLA